MATFCAIGQRNACAERNVNRKVWWHKRHHRSFGNYSCITRSQRLGRYVMFAALVGRSTRCGICRPIATITPSTSTHIFLFTFHCFFFYAYLYFYMRYNVTLNTGPTKPGHSAPTTFTGAGGASQKPGTNDGRSNRSYTSFGLSVRSRSGVAAMLVSGATEVDVHVSGP